ncbi:MAG TPA: hypothetical protein VE844_16655, partial [Gammaproteobacteria bacterium]|nr:hypothetical protein [Gammaproteobacteria bacterium]
FGLRQQLLLLLDHLLSTATARRLISTPAGGGALRYRDFTSTVWVWALVNFAFFRKPFFLTSFLLIA